MADIKMACELSSTPELGETKSTIMLSMTDAIRVALKNAPTSSKLKPVTLETVTLINNDSAQRVPYQLLEDLCKQQFGPEYYEHLSSLLQDTKWFYGEGDAPKPRDRSTESTVQQIRNDAAQRAYQRMTVNVNNAAVSAKGEWSSVGRDLRQMSSELTAVFNFLITVAAGFLFGYMASEMLRPKRDLFLNVLSGIVLAVIVGGADLYFLLRYMASNDTPPANRRGATRSQSSAHAQPLSLKHAPVDRKPSSQSTSVRQLVSEKYKAAVRNDLMETKKEQ